MISFKCLIVFAVIAFAASELVEDDSWYHTKMNFKRGIVLMKSVAKSRVGTHINLDMFERSMDMECVVDEIREKGFEQKLADLTQQNVVLSEHEELQLALIMVKSGMPCSSKARPITSFMFDFVMSFGHIVRTFKDEPEYAEQNFMLRCANDFAIKRELIDQQEYDLDRQMWNPTEQQKCADFEITALLNLINNFPAVGTCMGKQIKKHSDAIMRTLLLTQVELTAEQKSRELNLFHESMMEILDDDATCENEELDGQIQLENLHRRREDADLNNSSY